MAMLLDNNNKVISEVYLADTFFKKFLGLMFKKNIPEDLAYYFPKTSVIHMFFMRFKIDVVYLKTLSENTRKIRCRIVKIANNIKPWLFSGSLKADSLLELKAGSPAISKIKNNEIVTIKK